MKKFLLMAVTAIGLLFTACSKDEVAQPVAEKSTVTFSVAAPELATRALGDGTTATQLSWAVYDKSNTLLFQSSEVTVMSDLKATVEIPFVNGMAYNILFWAEAPESPYSVEWANLEVGYTNAAALDSNSEKYDAFYCYFTELGEVTGPVTKTVELKRPFAQLNIITNDHDDAVKSGLNVDKVSVEISEGCDKFNLANGEGIKATAGTKITFDEATKLANDHLAVNYLFTGGEKSLVNVTFAYTDGDLTKGGDASRSMEFAAVPVQRNYRTNIVGSLLTSDGKFNIEIKPGFDGEPGHNVEVVTVASAQDLQEAINNAPTGEETNITLTDDIDLNDLFSNTRAAETNTVTLAKGKKLVLDLNGFRLTGTDNTAKNYGLIQNNGDLTIVGPGTIETTATINSGWNRYSAVVSNNPGAVLTVENGAVLEHKGGTDMAYGIDILTNGTIGDVKATINGATIKSTYRAVRQFLNSNSKKNELIIKAGSVIEGAANNYGVFFHDPSTKANNGTLIIEEGATVQGVYLFVTAGSTEWPVEFSIAVSSITGEKGVVAANVPAGLAVGNENGVWTKFEIDTEAYVANIGTQGYETLQAAIEAVQEGETISLTKDLEQEDGVLITDKNITIDLKNKSFTVSEGASTNNRNFKINGNSVVTIKNGTLIAEGELTSGAYGTIRTEDTATVTLNDVKLYSYRGYGLNVKALDGTKVTINDSEIYSQYSGGVEAAGGEIVLNNVTIDQNGVYSGAAWCSVAIGVNGGGKVVVNSGTYSAETIAEDANAAQGTWVAYVMSSGGTLEINGGTFTGGDSATANAANACGIICADRAAVVNIYGGTFNAQRAILDMRNNVGTLPNPIATLYGGDFSHNPTVSGLYSSNLINVAEGKVAVQQSNGRWTLVDGVATAEALVEAVAAGGDVVLGADITVDEPVIIPEGKTVILNMNGKTLSAADEANKYALNNHGTLTITGNGVVNARGIYNGYSVDNPNSSAKLIIENGTFNAKGTDGGACIFNYGIVEVNGGQFTSIGGYSLNNQNGSSMTIVDATVTGGIYNVGDALIINGGKIATTRGGYTHAIYHNGGVLTVNDGEFEGNGNEVINANSCVANINGGSFKKVEKTSYLLAGSQMTIYNGTFVAHESNPAAHPVRPDVIVKGGTFNYKHTNIADGYKIIDNGDGTWSVVAE